MTRMLDRLASETAALRGEGVTLIGSSLGGTLAILAASRLSDRIDRLVLLAPAVMFAKDGHHLLSPERIEEWRRKGAIPFFHYGYNEERLLDFGFYEDTARYDAFEASVLAADVDLSRCARHVSGPPHRGAVRAHAPERHPVASRRRSSAHRKPAQDLE